VGSGRRVVAAGLCGFSTVLSVMRWEVELRSPKLKRGRLASWPIRAVIDTGPGTAATIAWE